MNESELAERIAAYALDVLSQEEKREVEAYLSTSPAAQQELATYRALLVGLATAVPRRKIVTPRLDQFRGRLAADEPPQAKALPATPTLNMQSTITRRNQARRPIWQIAAAVAAVIIVAVGLLAAYQSTNDQRTIDSLLNNSTAKHLDFAAQPVDGTNAPGSVSFVTVPGQSKAVLQAQLPVLTSQQYELWFIKDNVALRSVVFDGAPTGKTVLVPLPDAGNTFTLALTIEPTGGSDQPTGAPIFAVPFTRS